MVKIEYSILLTIGGGGGRWAGGAVGAQLRLHVPVAASCAPVGRAAQPRSHKEQPIELNCSRSLIEIEGGKFVVPVCRRCVLAGTTTNVVRTRYDVDVNATLERI